MKKLILAIAITACAMVLDAYGQRSDTKPPKDQDNTTRQRNGDRGRGFARFDLNGDGYIMPEEWQRNRRAFERMDFNGDGRVSREEWETYRNENGRGNKPRN